MKIAVVGTGHVGLVTAVCLADMGHQLVCTDHDEDKLSKLQRNVPPFHEPGLLDLLVRNVQAKRLSFTPSMSEAVRGCEIAFICVSTPPNPEGATDLTAVESVAGEIGASISNYTVVVEKSTVPVKTGVRLERIICLSSPDGAEFDVASVPEFLREGSAINDFMNPDRIVIGVESQRAQAILMELFRPFNAPILVTNIATAELIKHASNSFLAVKISYINAIAQICDAIGADVLQVAEGMGLDPRIGPQFLQAGIGYGGPCLPKDVSSFIAVAEDLEIDFQLLKATAQVNRQQCTTLVDRIGKALGILGDKKIAVLGLAFKPNTDDIRGAPAIDVLQSLLSEGASIRVYDPEAMAETKRYFGDSLIYCDGPYEAASGSDALILLTEWKEFSTLDLEKLRQTMAAPLIFDGRNIFDPALMKQLGFDYHGIGR